MAQISHKSWLKVTAVVVASFAPIMFLGAMPETSEPARLSVDLLNWPVDGVQTFADPTTRFLSALMGGFLLGWGVMIWMLLAGVTPAFAACYAIAALILTSWTTSVLATVTKGEMFKPIRMGPSKIAEALIAGVRSSIMTAILLVTIGVMNNAIVTSGVGNGFSLMIAQWSQGSLVLAILLIGLVSLVLGMGLPVTAAYIILAILTAPALSGIMQDALIADPPQLARDGGFIAPGHDPDLDEVCQLRDEGRSVIAGMPWAPSHSTRRSPSAGRSRTST